MERAGAGAAVAFRGEEVGCIGSRALVARGGPLPRTFVELHIEQGTVLECAGAQLGVVTGIAGYARGELVLEGPAGATRARRPWTRATTPWSQLPKRSCAFAAPRGREGAVATVGQLEVEPGGVNVIPDRVRLSVDARAPDRERLDALLEAVGLEPGTGVDPVRMDERCRRALCEELDRLGLRVVEFASGAGHDAGVLAAAASGMLFVRSLNGGVSHSPDELSSEEDVALAADVLAGALRRLAASSSPPD